MLWRKRNKHPAKARQRCRYAAILYYYISVSRTKPSRSNVKGLFDVNSCNGRLRGRQPSLSNRNEQRHLS